MMITKLHIRNFRNYQNVDLSFDSGVQMILGKNAQGKTNLLEAILYLSTTRSHRSNDNRDLIRYGEELFIIEGEVARSRQKIKLKAIGESGKKHLMIYQETVAKVSQFIGECNVILFCPDDLMLFQAAPKVRRRFIDMELSKMSKVYTQTLLQANKLLKERNQFLKQNQTDDIFLGVLDEQLAEKEVTIMEQRKAFLAKLIEFAQPFYRELSDDDTMLSCAYHTFVSECDKESRKQAILEKRKKCRERDYMLKQTTIGCHKDDVTFYLNDHPIEEYASQGQKRCVLLAMKIGLVHMIYELTKEYPILLLDDVFSELDQERRKRLLKALPKEVQIFISATDLDVIDLEGRSFQVWKVHNGTIHKLKGGIS